MADNEEKKELTQEELENAAGGILLGMPPVPPPVYYKPRPVQVGTCNECAIKGNMNAPLYSVPGTDIKFCLDEGHIFRGMAYDHTNKDEARGYF